MEKKTLMYRGIKLKTVKENVTRLDLSNCGIEIIEEIENLSRFTNLRVLNLSGNNISNITGLNALKNLTELNLGGYFLSAFDLNKVKCNCIQDIGGLDEFVELRFLNLSYNKIKEIKRLDSLSNLEKLNLSFNSISEISGLTRLVNLRELYLDHNAITKIEGLASLEKLSILTIGANLIPKAQYRLLGGVEYCKALNPLAFVKKCQGDLTRSQLKINREELSNIDNLKKLAKTTDRILINDMATMLEISRDACLKKIIDWADQFGFRINKDEVIFAGGQVEDFINALNEQYKKWETNSEKMENKRNN